MSLKVGSSRIRIVKIRCPLLLYDLSCERSMMLIRKIRPRWEIGHYKEKTQADSVGWDRLCGRMLSQSDSGRRGYAVGKMLSGIIVDLICGASKR